MRKGQRIQKNRPEPCSRQMLKEFASVLATAKVVCLKELQRPGGKKLPAREFLAGHPIKEKELLE